MANHLFSFTSSEPIFVDTNILLYQQAAHPRFGSDCRDFLEQIERGDLQAATSNVVINEAAFIAQTQCIAHLVGTPNRNVIRARLARDEAIAREAAQAVLRFLDYLASLQQGGLTVFDVEANHYREACKAMEQHGLFVSDATHVVLCRQLGIRHIATNDNDLDRVPYLTRWAPGP